MAKKAKVETIYTWPVYWAITVFLIVVILGFGPITGMWGAADYHPPFYKKDPRYKDGPPKGFGGRVEDWDRDEIRTTGIIVFSISIVALIGWTVFFNVQRNRLKKLGLISAEEHEKKSNLKEALKSVRSNKNN